MPTKFHPNLYKIDRIKERGLNQPPLEGGEKGH